MLAWGPWRPDVGGPNSGFAEIADNVMIQSFGDGSGNIGIGYRPFPQLTVQSTATTPTGGAPRGAISLLLNDGTNAVFFATGTTIEQMSTTFTWTSIETGRAVTSGDDVSLLKFGDYLLNSDTTDGFKAYNVQTPAGNNSVSGAPSARFLFSCNNVVFALDCNGNNRRMQSSGIGDHNAWATKGANGKTFEDGGALQAGVDLQNGNALVFQSEAIRRIQFGTAVSPALYGITKVANGRGSVGYRSVVAFDGMAFYLASDGFYKFTLDGGNQPIGAEKINRWFLQQVDNSRLANVQGSVDPKNKIVIWRFNSVGNSSAVSDRAIGYDWQLNEWFTLTVNLAWVASIKSAGYTLETMDVFGTLDGMVQTLLDDRLWQGGTPLFGGMDTNYKFGTFSGGNLAYTLQTFTMNSPFSQLENELTPISDNSNGKVAVGFADKLSSSLTWKTAQGKTRAGRVKLRGHGLNIAFQETGSAGDTWSFANGIDYVDQRKSGSV